MKKQLSKPTQKDFIEIQKSLPRFYKGEQSHITVTKNGFIIYFAVQRVS